MFTNSIKVADLFYELKRPTITNVKSTLKWANEHSIKTFIDYLDCSESFSRQRSDMTFHEVLKLIKKTTIPFFRIILRKNFNWFGILTNDKHMEDVVEIALRGVDVGRKEIFVFCYLKKELFKDLSEQFNLIKLT